jgi:hypothetical protein
MLKRVLITAVLLTLIPAGTVCGQSEAGPQPGAQILADRLGIFSASAEAQHFPQERLGEIAGARDGIFREYRVSMASSRDYGQLRIELFETQSQFAAFGLFSFELSAEPDSGRSIDIGDAAASVGDQIVVWKDRYFYRVLASPGKTSRAGANHAALARALADSLPQPPYAAKSPSLLGSLPIQGQVDSTRRYIIGPEALGVAVPSARNLFPFSGDAEAVTAKYQQTSADAPPLDLVIVEYHTPQLATDAMAHVTGAVQSLPEEQQNGMIVEREGNFIIQAANVTDRDQAQSLVDSIQYPYTVKWLRNPLWPTNDPFRAQKAAQMLLSTFGLLGLLLAAVLVGGGAFGATVFFRRRRQQRQAFSDAGGMLRLDIDPFDSVMLGLPPPRDEG